MPPLWGQFKDALARQDALARLAGEDESKRKLPLAIAACHLTQGPGGGCFG